MWIRDGVVPGDGIDADDSVCLCCGVVPSNALQVKCDDWSLGWFLLRIFLMSLSLVFVLLSQHGLIILARATPGRTASIYI